MKDDLLKQNLLFTNGRLILADQELPQSSLSVIDGLIDGIYAAEQNDPTKDDSICLDIERVDLQGDILIPGLIDLHVHGCGGADVMDAEPEALTEVANALLKQGTTGFLATTMTAPTSRLETAIKRTVAQTLSCCAAELLGFHLEGPCLSERYRGAQKIIAQRDVPIINSQVKLITIAPELPEAEAYFTLAKDLSIILSVGHSAASYEQMLSAINRGVSYLTHAFNAMPGIHHRNPGLLTAALLDSRLTIELIADGVHIHPAVLELALRLKSPDNVVLVSDGTRAVGLPDGDYELGGQISHLRDGKLTLDDGTIAGSAKPLLAGVKMLATDLCRPLYEAVRLATLNPARIAKVDRRLGSLSIGKEATFLRLDDNLNLKQVWLRGRLMQKF